MQNQSSELYNAETFPLVTVFMLSYKKFNHIYGALDSVLEQDYPNYEFIIADDGSGNFPEAEITEYINKHATANLKRVLIYSNEKNLGTVKNCNGVIKRSRGRYIMGVSPDDAYAGKEVLSDVVKEFQSSDALVITSKRQIITEEGILTRTILPEEEMARKIRLMEPTELYREMLLRNLISAAGTYYDRRCFEQYKLFDERFFLIEDWPTYLHLLRDQVKIHFFDKVTFLYRLGGVSTSQSFPRAYIEDIHKVYQYFAYPYIKAHIRDVFDLEKKQAIYGIGNESSKLLEVLQNGGIAPACYIVNDGFLTENMKNDLPVYALSDMPFKKDKLQVLISKRQIDADVIIDRLKSKSFSTIVIDADDFSVKATNISCIPESLTMKKLMT